MTIIEEWRWVVGYEGYYKVSNLGNVRSVDRTIRTKDGRIRHLPGVPISQHLKVGYPFVRLTRNSKAINAHVHRLVAFAFVGPPEPGQEVRHIDGDRLNPRADNLQWGTRSQNVLDAVAHGTFRNQNVGRTNCKRGHEFDEANTYIPPSGNERQCRRCRHERYLANKGSA